MLVKAVSGTLSIVSTPIGNIKDITIRAIDTLKSADIILCEDTRVTRKLLSAYEIKNRTASYHAHNESEKLAWVMAELSSGKNIAMVSDAGTPLISDPGFLLIRACHEQGINVTAVPGACAAIAGITISGINCPHFIFYGFLPKSKGSAIRELQELSQLQYPIIFYESSKRLYKTLCNIYDICGDRQAAVVREITKMFEDIALGPVSVLCKKYKDGARGEVVLILEGAVEKLQHQPIDGQDLSEDITSKQQIKEIARKSGVRARDLYNGAMKKKER